MQKASFDDVAGFYDVLAKLVYGKSVQKSQTRYLYLLPPKASVLIIGGGSGWIIQDLIRQRPLAHITFIEASENMLRKAKVVADRCDKSSEIDLIHGNEEQIPVHRQYDAVLLFFVLDMYNDEQAQALVKRIKQNMKQEALWLFADFEVQHSLMKSLWQKVLLGAMQLFFRFCCGLRNRKLPSYEQVFASINLCTQHQTNLYGGFIKSAVYQEKQKAKVDAPF